jgi:hypothetical protein
VTLNNSWRRRGQSGCQTTITGRRKGKASRTHVDDVGEVGFFRRLVEPTIPSEGSSESKHEQVSLVKSFAPRVRRLDRRKLTQHKTQRADRPIPGELQCLHQEIDEELVSKRKVTSQSKEADEPMERIASERY